MSFTINLGHWNSVFAVPSSVVDQHIKLAGSAQLKVLLWVLRHAGEPFQTEDIASALSMHPADVTDAMQYWVETGLILSKEKTLLPGEYTEPSAPPLSIDPKAESFSNGNIAEPPKRLRPLSRSQKPDNTHVAKRIGEEPDLASMVQEAQMILGKTISNGDCATLLMLHDNDGLPVDVILMLLQYAVSIGKPSMKYIEKVGISWAEEEIDSHEKAEQKLRMLSEKQNAWRLVETTIGIDHRSPSSKEAEAADRWVNQWNFSGAMIRLAYERCVDAKGKYIVGYTDSILKRWHQEGVQTIEQAHAEKRTAKQDRPEERYSPSYNIDEYERTSIFDDLPSREKEQ
ncbi:MAG: DnaD domain protein [Clostridiales bacterium]|jgi:DnaD/phage-associated family protein|nr:DnaD domain protein [Clostridiales bacterium]